MSEALSHLRIYEDAVIHRRLNRCQNSEALLFAGAEVVRGGGEVLTSTRCTSALPLSIVNN